MRMLVSVSIAFATLGLVVTGTEAFTATSKTTTTTSSATARSNIFSTQGDVSVEADCRQSATRQQHLIHYKSETENNKQKDCHMPCENPFDDDDDNDDIESRREALFSMAGALWAVTTSAVVANPKPAQAASGDFAKIELPNPYQTLSDRATKQCLSESLGNRECLVYAGDEDKYLYKGLDGDLLFQRLKTSTDALAKLPVLIESKKWSQVMGVMTGPMGELLRTMNQMVEKSSKTDEAIAAKLRAKTNDVKKDLYAIQAAVDKKQVDAALKNHGQATTHLDEFIRSAL